MLLTTSEIVLSFFGFKTVFGELLQAVKKRVKESTIFFIPKFMMCRMVAANERYWRSTGIVAVSARFMHLLRFDGGTLQESGLHRQMEHWQHLFAAGSALEL